MRKFKITLTLLFLLCALGIKAQDDNSKKLSDIEKEAEALAQAQLEAYNNRDIEAFLIPYSEDVKVYNFPNELSYEGKDKMRPGYTQFFQNAPNLHCELVSRMVLGNKVIDREKVTGFSDNADDVLHAVAIYTIENGKISEVRFMRP